MREAIRLALSSLGITLYQPHVITVNTIAPFCVLTMNEVVQDLQISKIHNGSLTIWCYEDDENYENLDTLRKLVMGIDRKLITTASAFTFKLKFTNKGNDFYDSEWKKIGCDLTFKYVDYIP